jgi:hypothetical protein
MSGYNIYQASFISCMILDHFSKIGNNFFLKNNKIVILFAVRKKREVTDWLNQHNKNNTTSSIFLQGNSIQYQIRMHEGYRNAIIGNNIY